MRRKITLLYIDSGGGHRAAATALIEVLRMQRRPWDIEMVCIQDILDSVDFVRRITGIRFQDVYNIMLRRGWTGGSAHLIRLMHSVIRMSHGSQVEAFRRHWRRAQPDMVVSLIPHFNRAIKEALDDVWPGVPYVTMLTDMADYPPNFWIERLDQHVICGSVKAAHQARALGMPAERIFKTSGMILHPRFYEPMAMDRRVERARIGMNLDLPAGLVLFGGEGSDEMVKIARALGSSVADAVREEREGGEGVTRDERTSADVYRRLHAGHSVLYGTVRFLHRKARPGQHQRGSGEAPASDCAAQRLDPGA